MINKNFDNFDYGLRLRPVELEDASFLIEQRRHPRAILYLGDTDADIVKQREWIAQQRSKPNDHYWICVNARDVALGAVGLYDISLKQAEWGRFVVRPGSKAAPGCLLLALERAFEALNLSEVYCNTVATNEHALRFYERAGLIRAGISGKCAIIGGQKISMLCHYVSLETWPLVRSRLQKAAASKFNEVSLET